MIPKSKHGAEIALNVIIIAAIGLLVLAVVLFIFGGKSRTFSQGVSNCEGLGGECGPARCILIGKPSIPSGECPVSDDDQPQYCCSLALDTK